MGEVWTFVAMGLQLQELYVAPRYMTGEAWDSLAEGLQWARREAAVLRDSHWAFGDPTFREVYCIASWDVVTERGFVFLHNPKGIKQDANPFLLSSVLELPRGQQKAALAWKVVKSISRDRTDAVVLCNATSALADGACPVTADERIEMAMLPFEVKVLELYMSSSASALY